MKRKLVQHGSSSLTVTLPVKWVQKFGLKKGSEISVFEKGYQLVLSADSIQKDKSKVISTSDTGIFTKNNLSHLYQLGYDDIIIRFDNPDTISQVRDRISNCLGFEIINLQKKEIHIKSIVTALDGEFDTLLRKAFQVTNEMAHGILEALESEDYKQLEEIRYLETLNNKYTDFCLRILNKKGHPEPDKILQIFEIVKMSERIADEFKYICDLLITEKIKCSKETKELINEAFDYYLMFYNFFYKYDAATKKKIYLGRKSLKKKYEDSLLNTKTKEKAIFHHLANLVEKTYDCAGAYFAYHL